MNYIQEKKPKVVIFVQRDKHDENDFNEIIGEIEDVNISFLLIGRVPQWKGGAPLKIAYGKLNSEDPYADQVVSHLFAVDDRAKSVYDGDHRLSYISVLDNLWLKDLRCIVYVDEDKNALHMDNSHLSLEGSVYLVDKYLGPEITAIFRLNPN